MATKRKRTYSSKVRKYKKRRGYSGNWKRSLRNNPIHYFKRTCLLVNESVSSDKFGGNTFQLTDLPNYTEFALFDQYKICLVKMKWFFGCNDYTSSAANNASRFFIVKDYNSTTLPTTTTELLEYDNCKIWMTSTMKGRVLMIRPKISQMLYLTGVTTAYQAVKPAWIDMTNAGTPHFGVRWACPFTSGNAYQLACYCTYYFKCRNTK